MQRYEGYTKIPIKNTKKNKDVHLLIRLVSYSNNHTKN